MRTSRLFVPLVAVMLLLAGCDWNQAGFNPWNSGNNDTEHALSLANVGTLHAAWSAPGPSAPTNGFTDAWTTGPLQELAVVNGRVYSLDDMGSIDAVDLGTGAQAGGWPALTTHGYACPGGTASVFTNRAPELTVANNRLYTFIVSSSCAPPAGGSGTYTVDLSTGTQTYDAFPAAFATVAPDGTVFRVQFGPSGIELVGGSFSYVSPTDVGKPAIRVTQIFTVENNGTTLIALDRASATKTWTAAVSGAGLARPSSDGTRVYLGTATNTDAFDAATGTHVWHVSLPGTLDQDGPTIGSNGLVYVQSLDHVYALDAATGATAWSAAIPASTTHPNRPTVSNGVVYVASGTQLSMFDALGSVGCIAGVCTPPATFHLAAEATSTPVVSHGAVFTNSGNTLLKLVP